MGIHTKENILIMIHIKESIELIHIKENILTMIHTKENIEVHVVQVGNWTALYVIHNVLVDSLELVQFVGEDSIHMVVELEQSHGHLANYSEERRKLTDSLLSHICLRYIAVKQEIN